MPKNTFEQKIAPYAKLQGLALSMVKQWRSRNRNVAGYKEEDTEASKSAFLYTDTIQYDTFC